jgi:hypothetical protein
MVENVADDGVEPKPAIIEASGKVKPIVNVKLKFKIPFQAHIAHIEGKPKQVPTGVGKVRGIEVDTDLFFITNERWGERDDLLGWVRRQAARAGFTISIEKEVKEAKEEKHCDLVKKIMRVWKEVVESPIEDSYASALLKFKEVYEPFTKFLEYVETTFLNTVKNKFVRAWTNKVLQLGCRTTNVVESTHEKLKKYLRSSVGDLTSCWDQIDKMLAIQLGEIQGSFGRSITIMEHK